MINGLDLFSGIGGISLALKEWVKPAAYCEIDAYCRGVLLSRMSDDELHKAPIWDDVQTLKGEMLPEIDIIYGGFPCQDISVAGKGEGLEGKRSGLFYEIMRLVDEVRPSFIFLENVPAITTRGLRDIAAEITKRGYDSRWITLSAAEIGANHKRNRWWLLAHTDQITVWNESGGSSWACGEGKTKLRNYGKKKPLAYSNGKELERCGISSRRQEENKNTRLSSWWQTEPDVGRVVDGLPYRVDRIKALGNAVVPEQAKMAFIELMGI